MKNNRTALLLLLTPIFQFSNANAGSCEGKGSVIVYGNGMFNTIKDAQKSSDSLRSVFGQPSSPTSQSYDIAYKRSEPILEQLVNVVAQKGVTEFEKYWMWIHSLETPPDWFKAEVELRTKDIFSGGMKAFSDLGNHMESYSKWIRSGYNVIIVSHSQGNFYANQVMRKLVDYGERDFAWSNHYSTFYSTERNPFFPKTLDLVANVQVATPVSETIANSPWTTFKDDLIINLVRSSLGALPANIGSPGAGLPPHGDLLGHSFEKAYLRNPESRAKIIAEIKAAQSRLRFPIAFGQEAVLITHPVLFGDARKPKGSEHLYFNIIDPDGRDYLGYNEENASETQKIDMDFVDCLDLRVGDSRITAETIVEGVPHVNFTYTAWPEGRANPSKEKPIQVNFNARNGIRRWDIGVIHMSPGKDKEPLKVSVELYPKPKPR